MSNNKFYLTRAMTEVEITHRLNALEIELQPLLDEESRLKLELRELKSPYKIGDIVEWKNIKQGTIRARIVSIGGGGVSRWGGIRIRQDGTDGSRITVWSWYNAKVVKAAI